MGVGGEDKFLPLTGSSGFWGPMLSAGCGGENILQERTRGLSHSLTQLLYALLP